MDHHHQNSFHEPEFLVCPIHWYCSSNLQPYKHVSLPNLTILLKNPEEVIDILNLRPHIDKKLRFYSSGMLQRAKVGLALFTQSDILLLDEPTSNMDPDNANLILDLIDNHLEERTYVLASNMEREYQSFEHILRL